jgi:multisubunit Na+/H+ antiporter MnhC subunit
MVYGIFYGVFMFSYYIFIVIIMLFLIGVLALFTRNEHITKVVFGMGLYTIIGIFYAVMYVKELTGMQTSLDLRRAELDRERDRNYNTAIPMPTEESGPTDLEVAIAANAAKAANAAANAKAANAANADAANADAANADAANADTANVANADTAAINEEPFVGAYGRYKKYW